MSFLNVVTDNHLKSFLVENWPLLFTALKANSLRSSAPPWASSDFSEDPNSHSLGGPGRGAVLGNLEELGPYNCFLVGKPSRAFPGGQMPNIRLQGKDQF